MSILRSEDMFLYKLIMSKDQEYHITDLLGQCEMAHFVNVNAEEHVYKLQYAEMVKRCDESERKLAFIIEQCRFYGLELNKVENINMLAEVTRDVAKERQVSVETLYDNVEQEVDEISQFIKQQTEGSRQMKDESNHLLEYYTVLKKAGQMIFGHAAVDVNRSSFPAPEDELQADRRVSNDSDGSED